MLCERGKKLRILRMKESRLKTRTPELVMYKNTSRTPLKKEAFVRMESNVVISGRILPMILPQKLKISGDDVFKRNTLGEMKVSKEKIKTAVVNIRSMLKRYELSGLDD